MIQFFDLKMRSCVVFTALALSATALPAQSATLTVQPNVSVSSVSPMLYGLMTEEINYSYDGGLYAEMVRNRSFQHRGRISPRGFLPRAAMVRSSSTAALTGQVPPCLRP